VDYAIVKGTRVRVRYFRANPNVSLAGCQPKLEATQICFDGIVRHMYGNAPTFEASTDIKIFVQPDDPTGLPAVLCPKCGVHEVHELDWGWVSLIPKEG
jgi:hypothetical protein